MHKFVVVNADDFGLCKEISEGIIRGFDRGILTSTSVAANGDYFHAGVTQLKSAGMPAGIHLTFVGGERPLTGTPSH